MTKKEKIIPSHYSWNSSIFTRGIIDPIKRRLGYVDENEHPVSLKESADGQELNRMNDTAKKAATIAMTGLGISSIPALARYAVSLPQIAIPEIAVGLGTGSAGAKVGEKVGQALGGDGYWGSLIGGLGIGAAGIKGLDALRSAPKIVGKGNALGYGFLKETPKINIPQTEMPTNVGWGPAQTIKVARTGKADQIFYPERWDVVREGANPHGIWLQGKYGIPRTETTNPGKGTKAANARNKFATRSNKYTGTVILDKPMVTVGEVPDRSALSYYADQAGADGLVYNGVYDNGYNNNQVILSFKRPNLRKIELLEAERLGIPKGERNQEWKIFDGKLFSEENPRFIAEGSESSVIDNGATVLKQAYGNSKGKTLKEAREIAENFKDHANASFNQMPVKIAGYTYDGKYYTPVYKQLKVSPLSKDENLLSFEELTNLIGMDPSEYLKSGLKANAKYFNPYDLKSSNFGEHNGKIWGIDTQFYKSGGILKHK